MRMIMTVLLMMMAFAVKAEVTAWPVVGHFEQRGEQVAIYQVEDVTHTGGERDAFAAQVGERLRAQTAEHGYEFCALICQAPAPNETGDTTWGARILTIRSQSVCPRTTACPEGLTGGTVDIHSHIHRTRYTPNDVDRLFLMRRYRWGEQVSTAPEYPSENDRALGEGYLVTPTRVFHLNEQGRRREVYQFAD